MRISRGFWDRGLQSPSGLEDWKSPDEVLHAVAEGEEREREGRRRGKKKKEKKLI